MTFQVRGNSLTGIIEHGTTVEVIDDPIEHGDLVIYYDPSGRCIKSCVGVPGDPIQLVVFGDPEGKGGWMVAGKLVYGVVRLLAFDVVRFQAFGVSALDVQLKSEAQVHCWKDWLRFANGQIPPDCYFMLGTIPDSIDSRVRGFIMKDQIIGKVINK